MIEFENWLYSLSYPAPIANETYPDGVTFKDLCWKQTPSSDKSDDVWSEKCKQGKNEYCDLEEEDFPCKTSQRPLDFIYERRGSKWNLDRYRTDEDLLKKI